ncbi:MAG: twin-arginine translocase TatA/TatE family subunit [Proteobacteria bacterium]|nr:twin-arginine translocase TatA/TatE family subunit [Pseudomonadota bacterium]MCZ6895394.1 twin-arginine translocase TatA/TatE family subunit [Gammaproteobacteria bacterium]
MSFGIKELVVILIIVMLIFGTKKIKGVGSDVGGWIADFRKAMREEPVADEEIATEDTKRVIEGEAHAAEDTNRVVDGEAHAEKEEV